MTAKLATALGIGLLLTIPSPGFAQEGGRATRGSSTIEEIVVQARKREELIQDTPVSVTALTGQTLRDAGVTRLDEIQTLVPNTFFQVGRSNQSTNLRMRGVGAGSDEIAFDPGVGVYVDGVFLPRALGQLVELFDVAQIDVLRGPQGTLFGKNTVGGAILIRTVRPQPETTGSISVQGGFMQDFDDLNAARVRAMLNVPLIEDRLLGRFSFMSKNSEGYVADAGAGPDKSDTNSYTFLGSLRFLPTDDITIDLSGTWGRDHNSGRGGQCVFFNEMAPLKNVIPGFIEACQRSQPLSIHTSVNGISDLESTGVWGTALWEYGSLGILDDVSVKAIGGWRHQSPRIQEDLDSTEFGVIEFSSVGGAPDQGSPGSQQQFNAEGQINFDTWHDRIKAVAGVFGLWETARFEPVITAGRSLSPPLSQSLERTGIDNWTWALFGQTTLEVTDWLSLTGGARYTTDKKGTNVFIEEMTTGNVEIDDGQAKTFERWTGMASAALQLPEDILYSVGVVDSSMLYYTFSQGFRGGGFNGVLGAGTDELESFSPEFLDNHEVGLKSILFEDRLTLNVAYFYGDYSDIQVITIRAIEDPASPTDVRIERVTKNAAEATVQGAEVEFRAIPLPGLSVDGSFGWIDATYDSFPEAADELRLCNPTEFEEGLCNRDRSGEGFDRVPRLESNLIVQYEQPIEVGSDTFDGTLIPRLSWSYTDNYHLFSRQVTPLIQSGYHLLGARLSYEFMDTRMLFALWAKNLTDQLYFNEGTPIQSSFGSVTRYYATPRTFGAELRLAF
jgi:iron complex outermembrane receptor protein